MNIFFHIIQIGSVTNVPTMKLQHLICHFFPSSSKSISDIDNTQSNPTQLDLSLNDITCSESLPQITWPNGETPQPIYQQPNDNQEIS